jgi:hypothetical protein
MPAGAVKEKTAVEQESTTRRGDRRQIPWRSRLVKTPAASRWRSPARWRLRHRQTHCVGRGGLRLSRSEQIAREAGGFGLVGHPDRPIWSSSFALSRRLTTSCSSPNALGEYLGVIGRLEAEHHEGR